MIVTPIHPSIRSQSKIWRKKLLLVKLFSENYENKMKIVTGYMVKL